MTVHLLNAIQIVANAYHIQMKEYIEPYENIEYFDYGLRKALIPDFSFSQMAELILEDLKTFTLIVAEDFCCYRYALLRLNKAQTSFYILGPWRTGDIPTQRVQLIKSIIGAKASTIIKNQYKNISLCSDNTFISILTSLILSSDSSANIQQYIMDDYPPLRANRNHMQATDDIFRKYFPAHSVEERYKIEEEIMDAVSLGNLDNALEGFQKLQRFDLVDWTDDKTQKIKYHLLICNTLLRKATEHNHMHPYYSSNIFYKYAGEIERMENISMQDKLIHDMTKEYCSNVHQYSLQKYSPQIQKAINYINQNLTSSLSLKKIAAHLHISCSYLSDLFRKETGQTLIEFINETRIHTAARILLWDSRTIASIAVSVGFIDVNYFTRTFKKIMGCTPTEYRKQYNN